MARVCESGISRICALCNFNILPVMVRPLSSGESSWTKWIPASPHSLCFVEALELFGRCCLSHHQGKPGYVDGKIKQRTTDHRADWWPSVEKYAEPDRSALRGATTTPTQCRLRV